MDKAPKWKGHKVSRTSRKDPEGSEGWRALSWIWLATQLKGTASEGGESDGVAESEGGENAGVVRSEGAENVGVTQAEINESKPSHIDVDV